MYMVTGNDDVFALNGKTGETLWERWSGINQKISTVCCGWLNRGLAMGEGMLFLGQLDANVVALDLKTGKHRELIDTHHIYGFIVVDYLGRAYHPMLGGDIVRYDPKTDKVERLKQTIEGKPPTPESHLADEKGHPINWDITPDGKTLYAQPMSTNNAYAYDLTQKGDTLAGRSLGTSRPWSRSCLP